jgi:hypothetical protein
MPVSFLSTAQRENFGRYSAPPTADELTRYFHLNDDDLAQILICRGEHNRLGFALGNSQKIPPQIFTGIPLKIDVFFTGIILHNGTPEHDRFIRTTYCYS